MRQIALVIVSMFFIPQTLYAQFGGFGGLVDNARQVKETSDKVTRTKAKVEKTKKDIKDDVEKIKNLPRDIGNDFRNAATWEYEKGRYLYNQFKRAFSSKKGATASQRRRASQQIDQAENAYSAHHGRKAAKRWAMKMRKSLAKLAKKFSPQMMKRRAIARAKNLGKHKLSQHADKQMNRIFAH